MIPILPWATLTVISSAALFGGRLTRPESAVAVGYEVQPVRLGLHLHITIAAPISQLSETAKPIGKIAGQTPFDCRALNQRQADSVFS